jgi:hypothetical protein
MARPRIIQLDQGKVSLQDFPTDVSIALVEHIKAFGKEPEGFGTTVQLEQVLVNPDNLPEKAISVKFDKKNLKVQVVEVNYNLETKEALVTNIEEFDNAKEAVVKFKVKASELNFV